MSSQNEGRQNNISDISDKLTGNGQSAPVLIPRQAQSRKRNDSHHSSYEDSMADSSLRTKRLPEGLYDVAESKRGRHRNFLAVDQNDKTSFEACENDERKPKQNLDNDMFVSQGSVMSSQQSMMEDMMEGDSLYLSDDEDMLFSQSEPTRANFLSRSASSKLGSHMNGNIWTGEPQLVASQEGGSEQDEISKKDSAEQKKRENNRKYARESRNKRNQKLENLEKQKVMHECLIEIYKKVITIYHKKLHNGSHPAWQSYVIQWYPVAASGHKDCQTVQCLLPILDTLLEELGNGPYGTIVPAGAFIMQQTEPSLCPDQKPHQNLASSIKHDDLINAHAKNDVYNQLRAILDSNRKDNFNSASTFEHLPNVIASTSLDKPRSSTLTSGTNLEILPLKMANELIEVNRDVCEMYKDDLAEGQKNSVLSNDPIKDPSQTYVFFQSTTSSASDRPLNLTTSESGFQMKNLPELVYDMLVQVPRAYANNKSDLTCNPSTSLPPDNLKMKDQQILLSADTISQSVQTGTVDTEKHQMPTYIMYKNHSAVTPTTRHSNVNQQSNSDLDKSKFVHTPFQIYLSKCPQTNLNSAVVHESASNVGTLTKAHTSETISTSQTTLNSLSHILKMTSSQELVEVRPGSVISDISDQNISVQDLHDIDSLQPSLETA